MHVSKIGIDFSGSGDGRQLDLALFVVFIETEKGELALLDSLSTSLDKCARRIRTLNEEPEDEKELFTIEDERAQLENLLGLAFICCQLEITRVISLASLVHDLYEKNTGRHVPHINCKRSELKTELMQRHGHPLGGTQYTRVTAIDAFANYFKHRDEWLADWSRLSRQSESTAAVIRALGASPWSRANIRNGFQLIFGDDCYEQVERFADLLQDWTKRLKNEYREQLGLEAYCD